MQVLAVCLLLLAAYVEARGGGGSRESSSGRGAGAGGRGDGNADAAGGLAEISAEALERELLHAEESDRRLHELRAELQEHTHDGTQDAAAGVADLGDAAENGDGNTSPKPSRGDGRGLGEGKTPLVSGRGIGASKSAVDVSVSGSAADETRHLADLFNKAFLDQADQAHPADHHPVNGKVQAVNSQNAQDLVAFTPPAGGLKSFAFGVVEELSSTIVGRLPCAPLSYVLSHFGWLLKHKMTGLIIDIGTGPTDRTALRALSATFPTRGVVGVQVSSDEAEDDVLLSNVALHKEKGVFTADILKVPATQTTYTEVSLAVFTCEDAACISNGFQLLTPALVPGSVIVFSKLVGFPSYLDEGLKVLYDVMQSRRDIGFEIIGGRFVDAHGLMCLTPRPKNDMCRGGVAIRIIASDGRSKVGGGHAVPELMPFVSQMCPGHLSAAEESMQAHTVLNASLVVMKTTLQAQLVSLNADRDEAIARERKLHVDLLDMQNRVAALESTLMWVTPLLICMGGCWLWLVHRVLYPAAHLRKGSWE